MNMQVVETVSTSINHSLFGVGEPAAVPPVHPAALNPNWDALKVRKECTCRVCS